MKKLLLTQDLTVLQALVKWAVGSARLSPMRVGGPQQGRVCCPHGSHCAASLPWEVLLQKKCHGTKQCIQWPNWFRLWHKLSISSLTIKHSNGPAAARHGTRRCPARASDLMWVVEMWLQTAEKWTGWKCTLRTQEGVASRARRVGRGIGRVRLPLPHGSGTRRVKATGRLKGLTYGTL